MCTKTFLVSENPFNHSYNQLLFILIRVAISIPTTTSMLRIWLLKFTLETVNIRGQSYKESSNIETDLCKEFRLPPAPDCQGPVITCEHVCIVRDGDFKHLICVTPSIKSPITINIIDSIRSARCDHDLHIKFVRI